ncbi:5-oxoprolinase subunit B family protein [Ekhidna sp. To15]|uniref:5-oxoprolinase subunit B family protein n=1 Tax=Ekhidna sp. To15 TaxID=3395267 RepID=UPI003F524825
MSVKESKSLLFNSISWRLSLLGERVILMECVSSIAIEIIHQSSHAITDILGEKLNDIVPTYHSIAIFTSLSIPELTSILANTSIKGHKNASSANMIELPICYEIGLDIDRIAKHANLSSEKLIELHLEGVYRSLFIGFTPGFIYADGLDANLACPRLENPRTKTPAGSVGIAGNQTGIYSLESPGGWNIIGRTPLKIFDASKPKPMLIDVGMKYCFYRITAKEFATWEK